MILLQRIKTSAVSQDNTKAPQQMEQTSTNGLVEQSLAVKTQIIRNVVRQVLIVLTEIQVQVVVVLVIIILIHQIPILNGNGHVAKQPIALLVKSAVTEQALEDVMGPVVRQQVVKGSSVQPIATVVQTTAMSKMWVESVIPPVGMQQSLWDMETMDLMEYTALLMTLTLGAIQLVPV